MRPDVRAPAWIEPRLVLAARAHRHVGVAGACAVRVLAGRTTCVRDRSSNSAPTTDSRSSSSPRPSSGSDSTPTSTRSTPGQGDDQAGFYGEEVYESGPRDRRVRLSRPDPPAARLLLGLALLRSADDSVDLLHIDGRHGYDDVREDFEAVDRRSFATAASSSSTTSPSGRTASASGASGRSSRRGIRRSRSPTAMAWGSSASATVRERRGPATLFACRCRDGARHPRARTSALGGRRLTAGEARGDARGDRVAARSSSDSLDDQEIERLNDVIAPAGGGDRGVPPRARAGRSPVRCAPIGDLLHRDRWRSGPAAVHGRLSSRADPRTEASPTATRSPLGSSPTSAGVFLEWYRFDRLAEAVGHPLDLAQGNTSVSKARRRPRHPLRRGAAEPGEVRHRDRTARSSTSSSTSASARRPSDSGTRCSSTMSTAERSTSPRASATASSR